MDKLVLAQGGDGRVFLLHSLMYYLARSEVVRRLWGELKEALPLLFTLGVLLEQDIFLDSLLSSDEGGRQLGMGEDETLGSSQARQGLIPLLYKHALGPPFSC